jgi:hypothetical protein
VRPSTVDSVIRQVDPISQTDIEAWRGSPAAAALRVRAMSGAEPVPPSVERIGRRSRVPAMALVAAVFLVIAAAAGTAGILLGEPAPPQVKNDLGKVDAGFPADLRYNPDVANARSVATTGASTLYFARLKDGGYCTEIVTSGTARGAVCTPADLMRSQPIEVTIPFTPPVTAHSPVTIGGRVNAAGVSTVQIRYGGGGSDPIALGDNGFFIFDVPAEQLGSVHAADFSIVGLDDQGQEVARANVPAIGEEPAGPIVDNAPITVDTISNGSDFTKVYGVRGRVNAKGAVTLEFRYPDGKIVQVPLDEDGNYSFDIPKARQGDLFASPGTLIARDRKGHEVASVPVAAVAFWRTHGGG